MLEYPKRTLRALKASIRKWDKLTQAKTPKGAKIGVEHCPLCLLFNNEEASHQNACCAGCPVATAAGQAGCRGTPFNKASSIRMMWGNSRDCKGLRGRFREAAVAERDFLISLLPEGEEWR